MKLEIEITEIEVRSAIERKVRSAIADKTNAWGSDEYIKARVKDLWQQEVDRLIVEAVGSSDKIREKIEEQILQRLRSKISKLMRDDSPAVSASVERGET